MYSHDGNTEFLQLSRDEFHKITRGEGELIEECVIQHNLRLILERLQLAHWLCFVVGIKVDGHMTPDQVKTIFCYRFLEPINFGVVMVV